MSDATSDVPTRDAAASRPSARARDGQPSSVLRARARLLARPVHAPDDAQGAEMLVCRVGAERYAFDLDLLREVRLPTGLTPVPCTPPFVAGVLNVRGEILTVLDLAALLDLPRRDAPPPSARAALVQLPEARVGLLVDEVLGVERIALDRLHRPLSGREYVRGVAEANLVCLNLRLLLTPARFKVAEEVG